MPCIGNSGPYGRKAKKSGYLISIFHFTIIYSMKNLSFVLIIVFLVLVSCMSGASSNIPENIIFSGTANPDASPDAVKVLEYLTMLSNSSIPGVISGQNCYHGNQITDASSEQGYRKMVEALYNKTGKWVGIIGVDYEFERIYTQKQLSAANKVLIDYWNSGGLVTITWTPLNPWVIDPLNIAINPGNWNGPGNAKDLTSVNMKDLLDPSKPVYQTWRRKLDGIAAALTELRDAGVVVMWRPMQEMNGNWHWWGMKTHPSNPSQYINVYRDMFDYFTNEKHLDNLLWVYSPNFGSSMEEDWNRPVTWAYPGDDYVDIVAGTAYNDKLGIADYKKYLSLKKPIGMAEFSPEIGGKYAKDGSMDTTLYADRLLNDYPAVAFWVSWHSYTGEAWSLIANSNSEALMNDPGIITRDSLDWRR